MVIIKNASALVNAGRIFVIIMLAGVIALVGYNCNINKNIQEYGALINGEIISFSVVGEGLGFENTIASIKAFGQKIDIKNPFNIKMAIVSYRAEDETHKYISFTKNSLNSEIGDTVQLKYSNELSRIVEEEGDYDAPFRLVGGLICFFLCIFMLHKISEDNYINNSINQDGGQRCLRCGSFIKKEKLFCGTCGTWTLDMNPKEYRPIRGANFLVFIAIIGILFFVGMFFSGFTFFDLIASL